MSAGIVVDLLYNVDASGGQVSFLAKTKYIDPGASSDGSEKNLERAGSTGGWRLVGGNSEVPKMGVHPGTTGEVDDHFHIINISMKQKLDKSNPIL